MPKVKKNTRKRVVQQAAVKSIQVGCRVRPMSAWKIKLNEPVNTARSGSDGTVQDMCPFDQVLGKGLTNETVHDDFFAFQSPTRLGWVHNDDLATNLMRVIDAERNYPVILIFFAIVAIFYRKCYMRVYASANAKIVLMEKKASISSAMSTALNWKVSTNKIRQEKLNKIHEQMDTNEENESLDIDPDNELEKSDAQIQYELGLQIPPPLKLYELLYDENEQNKTLYFGIDQSKYEQLEKLLCSSLKITLNEYTNSTKKARQPDKFPLLEWQHFSEVLPFQDGIRLKELVQLVRKKILKNLGSHVLPVEELQAAEDYLQRIGAERIGGYKILLQMALPSLPFILASLALNTFKTWGDVMVFSSRSAMLNGVDTSSVEGLRVVQQTTLSFLALRGFFECIGMLCNFLRTKAAEKFSLPLRTAVMQGLLRQDIEYFDRQKLQPLIDAATEESGKLAWVLFRLPMEMVSCITGMVTASIMIYTLAPEMFVITFVPCIIMGTTHYFICRFMEKKWIRREKLRGSAKEKASELLNKIRTVREFAMEISESEKRSAIDAYSVEVETQISSFETCIWHTFGIFWAVQHGLVTHFGPEQIYKGSLQLGTLMAISDQMGRITWSLRHLLERSPVIFKALEPAQRISDILTAFGSIEGDPFQNKNVQENTVTNGFRRPKTIEGRIQFKNVRFSYPSDPRKKILRDLSFSTNPRCTDPKKRVRTIACKLFLSKHFRFDLFY